METGFELAESLGKVTGYYAAGCTTDGGVGVSKGIGDCMPSDWRVGIRPETGQCEPADGLIGVGHARNYSGEPGLLHKNQNMNRSGSRHLAACPRDLADLGQCGTGKSTKALQHNLRTSRPYEVSGN